MNRSPGDFSPAFSRCRRKRFGQPWCLMSPIGRKASVEREISPSHLAPSSSSPLLIPPSDSFSSLQVWGYLRKIDLARLLQPRKLGFRYGGSSILLDNPANREAGNTSLIVGDILSTRFVLTVLEW